MIAKRTFVPVPDLLESINVEFLIRHFAETAPSQVRLAADESEKARPFRFVRQRRAITGIEVGDLFKGEISKFKARPDIERRLVQMVMIGGSR